ncbi:glycoside hydrolase family 16 protein [Kitasatospora sp. NPDC097643]|uniref:glycoside hydrolase family 16 protein n=1 Tax=Kitasatospora sp. NPDC097643 TaxID=3157230 RepID=UPI0033286765
MRRRTRTPGRWSAKRRTAERRTAERRTVNRATRIGRAAGAGLLVLLAATSGCAGGGPEPTPDAPGAWHLVFKEEFHGSTLDPARWTTCYDWNNSGCTNSGNHESEWYLPGQVSVGGGAVTLHAQRAGTPGSDGHAYPWASGMISTGRDSWDGAPRFTFTHGYVAAAVRIPPEQGMYPAFWLMPVTRVAPPEIDIAEFLGTSQNVQQTVHWAGPNGADQSAAGHYGPLDFPAGYHVFALDWEADSLTWFVDGQARFWMTDPSKIPDVAMEILLNLAVGVPNQPSTAVDSAQMQVSWVRVWQH